MLIDECINVLFGKIGGGFSCVDCDDYGRNVREVIGTENVIWNAI